MKNVYPFIYMISFYILFRYFVFNGFLRPIVFLTFSTVLIFFGGLYYGISANKKIKKELSES